MKTRLRRFAAILTADMVTVPGGSSPGSVLAEVAGIRLGKSGDVIQWPTVPADPLAVFVQIIEINETSISIRIYTSADATSLDVYIVEDREPNTDVDDPEDTITPAQPYVDHEFTGLVLGSDYYILVIASDA